MSRRKKSFSRLSRRGKNCIKEYLSNLKTHFEALNYNSQLLEPFIAGNFLRAQKKFPFDKSSPQLNTFVGVELPFKKLWNDSQLLFSPLVRGEERKVNYGEKTSPLKRDTCFGTHKFASFFPSPSRRLLFGREEWKIYEFMFLSNIPMTLIN